MTTASLMKRVEAKRGSDAIELENKIAADIENGRLIAGSEDHNRLKRRVDLLVDDDYVLNDDQEYPATEKIGLLVVDEFSQLSRPERKWLDNHGGSIPILLLGDDFQLPPIQGEAGAFDDIPTSGHLTKIMRGNGSIAALLFRCEPCGYDDGVYGDIVLRTCGLRDIPREWWQRIKLGSDAVIAPMHWQKRLRHGSCGASASAMSDSRRLLSKATSCWCAVGLIGFSTAKF